MFYEPEVKLCFEKFLKNKQGAFVDIGSNWGHHSFDAILNYNSTCYAFEPNPMCFADLIRICDELKLQQKLKAFQVALTERDKIFTLNQKYYESGLSTMSENFEVLKQFYHLEKIKNFLKLNDLKFNVKCSRLDDIKIKNINLIKIDAEGSEFDVLLGSVNTIKQNLCPVIFEFDTNNSISEFEKYISYFSKFNYKIKFMVKEFFDDKLIINFYNPDEINYKGQFNVLALEQSLSIPKSIVINL